MIVVDTSVFIEYLTKSNASSKISATFRELVEEDLIGLACPVYFELLSQFGQKKKSNFETTLAALNIFFPSDSTWERLSEWIAFAVKRGHRFGFSDLMIAALARENNCPIFSLDQDFVRMEKLGFIKCLKIRK